MISLYPALKHELPEYDEQQHVGETLEALQWDVLLHAASNGMNGSPQKMRNSFNSEPVSPNEKLAKVVTSDGNYFD